MPEDSNEDATLEALRQQLALLEQVKAPQLALLEEAERHRQFLHASLRWTTACILALVAAATGAAAWIFGDRLEAAAASVIHEQNVAARISESVQREIETVPRLASDVIEARVPDLVLAQVKEVLDGGAERAIQDAMDEKLKQIEGLDDEEVKSLLLAMVPVGTVVAWPGRLPPSNDPWHNHWHVCDGSEIEVGTPPSRLSLALSDSYGSASEGFVTLPDFRGRFLRGTGGLGLPIGEPQHWSLVDHSHSIPAAQGGLSNQGVSNLGGSGNAGADSAPSTRAGSTRLPENLWDEGRIESEVRPSNYAIHWVIRIR